MAFDEKLAARIRKLLAGRPGLREQKMFGGVAFMIRGNMCCGIAKDELMVRILVERTDELLTRPQARMMDLTGRLMKGFLLVRPEGYRTAAQLKAWVEQALECVGTLKPKRKG